MATAQFILQILIVIGVFYVIFVQERTSKFTDRLLRTLKDYPEIAERRIQWKEENMAKEAEAKTRELKDEIVDLQGFKDSNEICVGIFLNFMILMAKLYPYYHGSPFLDKFIEEMDHDKAKWVARKFLVYLRALHNKLYRE